MSKKHLENLLSETKHKLTPALIKKYTTALSKNSRPNTITKLINELKQVKIYSNIDSYRIDGEKIENKAKLNVHDMKNIIKMTPIHFENSSDGKIELTNIYGNLQPRQDIMVVFEHHDKTKKRYLLISTHKNFTATQHYHYHEKSLRGLKDRFHHYYYQVFGDRPDGKGNFYIFNQTVRPEKYLHYLKEGDYNCLLKQVKDYYKDNTKKCEKIDVLNTKYFSSGISFEEIEKICKSLVISIIIKNKCDTIIYKYIGNERKIFEYVITHNNHVEICKNLFGTITKKNIIYVDDINKAFDLKINDKKLIAYKRGTDNDIKYFYDDINFYKSIETKDYDNNEHFINSYQDLLIKEFEETNKLNHFIGYDKDVFNFINLSCHHLHEIYFNQNIDNLTKKDNVDYGLDDFEPIERLESDLSKYTAYDKNKAYANYNNLESYKVCSFPASHNFDLYISNTLSDIDLLYILMNKSGFIQINNIKYINKTISNIKYFINDYIYPINVLYYAVSNNIITFDVKLLCISNWKQDIIMSNDFIENKIYNKLFGVYSIQSNTKTINMRYENINELQDLLFYSNNITHYTDNEISLQFDIKMSNKAHIASYIYGYNMITIMEKLQQIKFTDLIGLRVDCIILKKEYDIFTISNEFKDWKIENKQTKEIYEDYNYINLKNIYGPNNNLFELTKEKIYYQKINYIMGGAGVGKTSRFYKKFDNFSDERLYNMAFGFPNNNLCISFDDMDNIKKYTYHTALNINVKNPLNIINYLINTTNFVIDEASMIGSEYNKIIEECNKLKINVFFVGDYSLNPKKLYQLEPYNSDSFIYNYKNGYCLTLTENHRQNKDKNFINMLNKFREMKNENIIKSKEFKQFNKITLQEMYNLFNINDIILSSVNEFCNKANTDLFNLSTDKIKVKYNNNSIGAKNQSIIINKTDYDDKIYNLNFSSTIHLIQGLTLTNKIFINCNNLFTENLLYVALSRATNINQIYLIS